MDLHMLPLGVLLRVCSFIPNYNVVNLTTTNRQLCGCLRPHLLLLWTRHRKTRSRWRLLRDIVRLSRRVTLAQRVCTFMHWRIEQDNPFPLLVLVLKPSSTEGGLWIRIFLTDGAEEHVQIMLQWLGCVRKAFPKGAVADAADSLMHSIECHDVTTIVQSPTYILSATHCLSSYWYQALIV